MKKTIFSVLLVLVSAVVFASTHEDLSACLPDTIGDYKSSKDILVTDHKDNVSSVSREYQHESSIVKVSIWKIPGKKEIWPYMVGKSKAKLIIVAGRMCILNVDETSNSSNIVINIDKSYLSPPPYLYRVSVDTYGTNGSTVVQAIGEKLNYDKLFGLYGK